MPEFLAIALADLTAFLARRGRPITLAAILMAFLTGLPAFGAVAQMNQVSPSLIEIQGEGWRLRYGTLAVHKKQFVPAEAGRAWFSHGRWLRMIDTAKGMVVGRWHFPGEIVGMVPKGSQVEVEIETNQGIAAPRQKLLFDPASPRIPSWSSVSLLQYRLPVNEAEYLAGGKFAGGNLKEISAERAKELIPEFEAMVHRDPLSPWLRLGLGSFMKQTGDPRAVKVFQEAAQMPMTYFYEFLWMSRHLDILLEHDSARVAFERGYGNFIEHGNDPRLMITLLGRIITYNTSSEFATAQLPPEVRSEIVERIYKVGPGTEGAAPAWTLYANYLQDNGRSEEAKLWRDRAEEARTTSLFVHPTQPFDHAVLVFLASFLAGLTLWFVLPARYRAQRRLALAARVQTAESPRRFTWFGASYWSRRERLTFFAIVLICWVAVGVVGGYGLMIERLAYLPIPLGMGSFSGPFNSTWIADNVPASAERDLFLALAYQQSGENEKAEPLYRRRPEFAESWNNLGVLLKETGREPEARQAFERALTMDPALPEAVFNLGRPVQGLWTEIHQKYLPGRPMIAPPKREHIWRALATGSPAVLYARALAGPVEVHRSRMTARMFAAVGLEDESLSITAITIVLAVVLVTMLLAVAILVLVPYSEVTQPAGGKYWMLEIVFPGVCRAWRWGGGLVLLLWSYVVVQDGLLLWQGTPYLFTEAATPDLARSIGIPLDPSAVRALLFVPGWLWVYAVPALLFAVNLFLVLRARRMSIAARSATL
ncbi:MAG: tetratricopeptide repeat protein [Acidobacteria bacterium]|nr:tetratricopeptide repeat protein [Acidobacteriota bacterium]